MSMFADTILPRREDTGLRRWGLAALAVLLAHVGLVVWLMLMRQSEMPPGNPPDAVMINLAPLAVAPPPQEEVETPPQPEEVQPETPPEPTPIEPQPPQPQQPTAVTQAPVAPDVLPAPQPDVMMAPPPPPKVEETPVEKTPPKPVVKHEIKQAKPQARAQRRTNLPRAATAAAPAPGFNGAALSSWKSEIVIRINSVKEYPEEARAQGTNGTASISFSVDRSGRVVSVRLSGSSGSSILDQAAVATLRRANPLPAPPADVPGNHFNFTVPLHFSVR